MSKGGVVTTFEGEGAVVMQVEAPPLARPTKSIFVVTVFGGMRGGGEPSRQRTWGWYSDPEDAKRAVLENHTDMYETFYYRFAVIEEVEEGVLSDNRPRWWYRASEGPGTGNDPWLHPIVQEIETPDWAKQSFGWGMG